jgi:hypothetical protein
MRGRAGASPRGQAQIKGAECGHADRCADLQGGGADAADVGCVFRGHGRGQVPDQRAELDSQAQAADAEEHDQ